MSKRKSRGKSVEKHESEFIHIHKDSLLPLVLLPVLALVCVNYFYLVSDLWFLLDLGSLAPNQTYSFVQFSIIPVLFVGYLLVSFFFVCLVALVKGGFSKVKPINEKGLIGGLIVGLIGGLIGGLIWGLIVGLIGGLIGGLISGLISGLIGGLIVGLISGLIVGLISGLKEESE